MFNPLNRAVRETERAGVVFSPPYEPEERERGEGAVREGAGGSWTAVARLFRGSGGFQERESFCEGNFM